MVAALFSFKDQPGLKASPSHSQEVVSPAFCLFVLWFWFGVFFEAGSCPQPREAVCCTHGGRKGTATFPSPDWPGLAVKGGQLGWEGARALINKRSKIVGFINYSKTKAKPLTCRGKASFLICCSSIISAALILTLKAEIPMLVLTPKHKYRWKTTKHKFKMTDPQEGHISNLWSDYFVSLFLRPILYCFRHGQTDNYNHWPKMFAAQGTKQEDGEQDTAYH